mmetsp:Transcript_22006/g.39440  ORF Transcript_22006/g.39440 Transcript_22006/m.39440 type:complete len:94 (-) Transcript_22006:214-495(-)|eukprot:CAMPEP_0197624912 /NCGR_PEP_ID=MMETSP1338-20131121/4411_1 /TAXON_ID=43686 ORGANISM="Pelagodinium beii, Strain RCC1491" /NCGR_SAMPLE_ID=MMETSP1338 /ASSEMBLY_ACC=CAM_ASM_000754 /LENGTH=93 /DNA_ID=CAMNT_0043195169 /DNA_START=1363 /DNA_END=1644 /DNA_ORIENTATION=-
MGIAIGERELGKGDGERELGRAEVTLAGRGDKESRSGEGLGGCSNQGTPNEIKLGAVRPRIPSGELTGPGLVPIGTSPGRLVWKESARKLLPL